MVTLVLPAYNAAKTLKQTIEKIPHGIINEIILVDDGSDDNTAALARESLSP